MSAPRYSINGMSWGNVELEPEVDRWIEGLDTADFGRVSFYVELLEERGALLSEPYTRQIDGKLRELRFELKGKPVRVTYWIASGRRIILLTVFTKSQPRERAQIARAKRAMEQCANSMHTLEEEYEY